MKIFLLQLTVKSGILFNKVKCGADVSKSHGCRMLCMKNIKHSGLFQKEEVEA